MATSEIGVVNAALSRLGIAPGLAGSGDLSTNTEVGAERRAAEQWLEPTRDRVLESVAWRRSKGYVKLVALDPLPDPLPWEGEYTYAYVYPDTANVVSLWRLVSGTGPWELRPQHYTMRYVDDQHLVLTNSPVVNPHFEVTWRITDLTDWPALMVAALEWGLAANMGPMLTADPNKTALAYQMYERALEMAQARQLDEDGERRTEDGSYVQVRGGGYRSGWGYGGHPIELP